MIVHHIPYRDYFYNIIIDEFRKRELGVEDYNQAKKRSAKNWEITRKSCELYTRKESSIPVTDSTFIGERGFPRGIFYRIRCDLNLETNKTKTLVVDDDLFIDAFNYIGIYYDSELDRKYFLEPQHKASILYQLFLEKYCPKFLIIHPELLVCNHDSNSVFDVLSIENPDDYRPIVRKRSSDKQMVPSEKVTDFLQSFFTNLLTSESDKTWQCLSIEFQNECFSGDFMFFISGYVWTLEIRKVNVFDIYFSDNICSCKVYFEEDIDIDLALKDLDLGKVNQRTLDVFQTIVDDRRTSKHLSLDLGYGSSLIGDDFLSVGTWYNSTVQKFLEENNIHSKNHELMSFNKVYQLQLIFSGRWQISQISRVKVH